MLEQLEQRMREIAREEIVLALSEAPSKPVKIEERINDMLHNLGISPALKGFKCIVKALVLVHDNPEAFNQITRYLYPTVGYQVKAKASQVERNIRNSVERAAEVKSSLWKQLFPTVEDSKVTNSEFIARLAEELRGG